MIKITLMKKAHPAERRLDNFGPTASMANTIRILIVPWDTRMPRSAFRNTIMLRSTASPAVLFSVPNIMENKAINMVQKAIFRKILNR